MTDLKKQGARSAPDGDKPGKYELVPRIYNSVVDPGTTVFMEIYITGYGRIDASKLAFYPPVAVLNETTSKVSYGFKFDPEKDDATWGGLEASINSSGFVLPLGGMLSKKWDGATSFFDVLHTEGYTLPQIMTEIPHGVTDSPTAPTSFKAPFSLELNIKKDTKPGTYYTSTIFTYFNGSTWQTSNVQSSFTVRNFFQRHETAIAWFGITAAIGSATGILSLLFTVAKWYLTGRPY